jgi:predicted dienelactone hydrolase
MRAPISMMILAAIVAQASSDATYIKIAGRDVAIWKPVTGAPKSEYPLIVFSHGFRGCATQSTFLMEAFAHAGYLVLAPNHHDAGCKADGKFSIGNLRNIQPEESFEKGGEWSAQTYQDRADDLKAILDAALQGPVNGISVDKTRVGIAGHSLGGYTALGLAGAWPSWKDPRIKAVLALSPFCTPYISSGVLGGMNVPVMYQGGTIDQGITPSVKRPGGAYALSSKPKFFVEFRGAGHLAWTGLNPVFHDVVNRYSVAFFDHYLKAQAPDALTPLTVKPLPARVIDVRTDSR